MGAHRAAVPHSGAAVNPEPRPARRARWGAKLARLEPLLWIVVFGFVLVRLAPQIGAWTGITIPVGERPPVTPQWAATTLEGAEVGSAAFFGEVYVVTFWATWCRVCAVELPGIQRLHERWQGEVPVVGISIDDGASTVRSHAAEKGYAFPMVMADRPLRMAFGGIPGVPTTFVVDRAGVVRHTLIGVTAPGTLERAVRRLVEEPDPPR